MLSVVTYDYPHKKTQDLLLKLKLKGFSDVQVFATPWQNRNNFTPLIPHRFFNPENIYPSDLCKNLSFDYRRINSIDELSTDHYVLIGGAGIIPKHLTRTNKIINAHPAYLPYVRGLDSLKWAIMEGLPVGVTTHIISEETDSGLLINRKLVPLHRWDTFHSVAYRQYEMEISMLADSIEDIKHASLEDLSQIDPLDPHETIGEVKKRMPHRYETGLINRFNRMIETCHA